MTSDQKPPSLTPAGGLALARAINHHLHKDKNPKLYNLIEQGLNQVEQEASQSQIENPTQEK